jgi:predicted nuclease with RNAse H fold
MALLLPGAKFRRWGAQIGTYSLRVVGVTLSGSERRPTGWAALRGPVAETALLRTDDEIVSAKLAVPDRGIIRDSERQLTALRVGVYPCLLPSMRALTARGMRLKTIFEVNGLRVIEGFPGAAQDSLEIPRKQASLGELRSALAAFGIALPEAAISHHELDAITAALVGQFFAKGRFHAFGAPDEVPIITPLLHGHPSVHLTAIDAPTLRFAANYLALFHGIRLARKGRATGIPCFRKRRDLRNWLYFFVTKASMSFDNSANAGL